MTRYRTVGITACIALVLGLSACSDTAPVSRRDIAVTHNDADVAFLQQMIPHHAQAIEMSDLVVTKSDADPQVAAQAVSISSRQASEIEMMRGWLALWGVGPAAAQQHHPNQCGMVSSADLTALQNAGDAAANRLYLELMIAHHAGAIKMARTEVDAGHSRYATYFAQGIISSQQREIDVMRSMSTPGIAVDEAAPAC
ncbi:MULTISPECIES: DUF305 domain-containing protein [Mycobacteriaceae]|jgi:uncharacterized protein (DUF305 family)|uniref:DUF305 domain-containing protein n=4 Tax=Mycobacteriaceae TaxID=1762 RepID=A0A0J6W6K8_9MYCO|nr:MULTISPECIES: DUF305 domain-containing protein [Mycobacteriaceae]KMO77463.1 hypothetical protein MCHLDSM_02651 [Mycolicibacterium chlorophenolicum]MCV7155761.1 DUF305 domain-containing protein [Mycolicibacterium pyrenivorans]MDN4517893.1 DUF305 domain-containing protein [Mycolicibacterium austroafricanum]QRZ04940.1 DUF305 domain-containing protein [Mycolicibacterium austroafricanum]QZT68821.1 DUF305 domain-containing protein [Mycolicibacterium austroafricanum]